MKINSSKITWIIVVLVIIYLVICLAMMASVKGDETEGRVKTVYDLNGRPVNQSQDAKGLHRVSGSVKLVAGSATISLNTNISDGRQDISFISANTYRGHVWVADTTNSNTYKIYPQSSTQFIIKSSDAADTITVNYWVEGE